MPRESVSRWNLVTGEDTFASQTSQNPQTSRRLLSLIPSIAGDLTREAAQAVIGNNQIVGSVSQLVQFDWNDGNGGIVRYLIAAVNGVGGWQLWQLKGSAWQRMTANLDGVVAPFGMGNNPQFDIINNSLHFSDGFNNFIFDPKWTLGGGVSPILYAGFIVPSDTSVWTPSFDATPAGVLNVVTNRYYWTTFADHAVNHVHESDASPRSAGTGALVNKKVRVYQQTGNVDMNNVPGHPYRVIGHGTNWENTILDKLFYVDNGAGGFYVARIASVTNPTTLELDPSFAVPPAIVGTRNFSILPFRSTHWHIYASESENSQVGYLLKEVPVGTFYYDDEVPFLGGSPAATDGNTFTTISRPFRNDPPPASLLLRYHKYRLWRRRESKPNFLNYTANEEVLSGSNGSPYESVPGADVNTLSDIINENPMPDQSVAIRCFTSHGDALWVGTERNKIPLFGETIDDFAFSQVTALSVGDHGRFASISTPHGMVFVSYDKKVYLYPTSMMPFAYVPKDVNVTENLVEIGRPIRRSLEMMDTTLDNARLVFYNYGRRNWLVLSYQEKNSGPFHTWMYDFETKGWYESQRGFASLLVWEPTTGNKILIGGTSDGFVYVIDDLTGAYTSVNALPSALWRPSLIDFGDPESNHMALYMEYELTNAALADDITINFYLDPADVDNPGAPRAVTIQPVQIGANKFRGFFTSDGSGTVCNRLLLEVSIASSTNAGALRGVKLVSQKVSGLLT